jgi:hypothetical protein
MYSQLWQRVPPYTMFFFGFGLCLETESLMEGGTYE